MIGVAVQAFHYASAQEFFELFKTNWEFAQSNRVYEVLISTSESLRFDCSALSLFFGPDFANFDTTNGIRRRDEPAGGMLTCGNIRLPIYGAVATFPGSSERLIRNERSQEAALHARRANGQTVIRIGYDLFAEIKYLLTVGQPVTNAGIPALDLHLSLLRDIITRAELPVVEIPPVPAGHKFIACLTHDIDHPLLRNHCCDHTMFGFLFRAGILSALNVLRRRLSLRKLAENLRAVFRLPFVHLGLVADTWSRFDSYLEIEAGLGATYFVISQPNIAGRTKNGDAPSKRACRYSLSELATQFNRVLASGSEVSLHGIDAWLDAEAGRREKDRLHQVFSKAGSGVRMHWLYFDAKSHAQLEEAGFSYDSTVGYNETIGYRAGTTQVYRPLGNDKLLELPLHVMDTALFYPSYLDLKESDANILINDMIDYVSGSGGVISVNWHDRSIFAERLWGTFYNGVLNQMKHGNAWFPTAGEAVDWFRERRKARIDSVCFSQGRVDVKCRSGNERQHTLPGLIIRVHRPCVRTSDDALAQTKSPGYVDVRFEESIQVELNSCSCEK